MIRMATVCSGIGAPEVASIGLGFEHVFMAEIEPFPSAVLACHWPHVPNLGDMTKIDGEAWCGKVDVLVGGTPCQAFSVAGKRESLNDERGNLTLKFVEICNAISPAHIVWENVPGVLSTADNAFGCFLGSLAGEDGQLLPPGKKWPNAGCVIGPKRKLAWRILDAQYFGLAQRRRRVFVVACPRNGADPREILFEREGVQRHSAPSREKGEGTTRGVEIGPRGGCFTAVNPTLDTRAKDGPIRNQLAGAVLCFGGNNTSGPIDVATAVNAHGGPCGRIDFESETFVRCTTRRNTPYVQTGMRVRRLTHVECERLQGFPDSYTAIPWRKKPAGECPDGPRYKALGNSMAVPVMRWILRRVSQTSSPHCGTHGYVEGVE